MKRRGIRSAGGRAARKSGARDGRTGEEMLSCAGRIPRGGVGAARKRNGSVAAGTQSAPAEHHREPADTGRKRLAKLRGEAPRPVFAGCSA